MAFLTIVNKLQAQSVGCFCMKHTTCQDLAISETILVGNALSGTNTICSH